MSESGQRSGTAAAPGGGGAAVPERAASIRLVPVRSDPDRGVPAADKVALGGSALLMVYVASLFIPGTFPAGPIVLSPYRLFLIATFVPLFRQLIRGRAGPVVGADIAVFLLCCWIALSMLLHHGPSRIVFIGTNFVEFFGAYLVGRVLVRSCGRLPGLLPLLPRAR